MYTCTICSCMLGYLFSSRYRWEIWTEHLSRNNQTVKNVSKGRWDEWHITKIEVKLIF